MTMIELELSGEAFEEIRDKCIAAGLIADEPRSWDEDSKPFTVGGITFKEWKYVPTPEEIARQEEYRKTPLGQFMEGAIGRAVQRMLEAPNPFLQNIDHPANQMVGADTETKIGTTLRIRLPRDYFNKIGDEWLDK